MVLIQIWSKIENKRILTSDTYSGVCGNLVCERDGITNAWETMAFY